MKLIRILTLLIACMLTLTACGPDVDMNKIVDVNNPAFDPMQFRYEDYFSSTGPGNTDMLVEAILTMFPPGTDISYVDTILVEQAGGTKESSTYDPSENMYIYKSRRLRSFKGGPWPIIGILFDENNKVLKIQINA